MEIHPEKRIQDDPKEAKEHSPRVTDDATPAPAEADAPPAAVGDPAPAPAATVGVASGARPKAAEEAPEKTSEEQVAPPRAQPAVDGKPPPHAGGVAESSKDGAAPVPRVSEDDAGGKPGAGGDAEAGKEPEAAEASKEGNELKEKQGKDPQAASPRGTSIVRDVQERANSAPQGAEAAKKEGDAIGKASNVRSVTKPPPPQEAPPPVLPAKTTPAASKVPGDPPKSTKGPSPEITPRSNTGEQLVCEDCKTVHMGSFASGRFCSVNCARSYAHKHKKVYGPSDPPPDETGKAKAVEESSPKEKRCENCAMIHVGTFGSGRFCTIKCSRSFAHKHKKKTEYVRPAVPQLKPVVAFPVGTNVQSARTQVVSAGNRSIAVSRLNDSARRASTPKLATTTSASVNASASNSQTKKRQRDQYSTGSEHSGPGDTSSSDFNTSKPDAASAGDQQVCEKCRRPHDGGYGTGRFCGVRCAKSRGSAGLKPSGEFLFCAQCHEQLSERFEGSQFCSRRCQQLFSSGSKQPLKANALNGTRFGVTVTGDKDMLSLPVYRTSLVGEHIQLQRGAKYAWFDATITDYDASKGIHKLTFQNAEIEWYDLRENSFRLVYNHVGQVIESSKAAQPNP
mmetsp:Transcript_9080/g.22631  ORF Transcript_9080/g.22631 Transcript_9080/m.22631 type:complete len:623 (-) Transcript_9080:433-2301(-)